MVVLHLTDGKLCRNREILSQWVQALSSEADLFVSDGSLEARSTLSMFREPGPQLQKPPPKGPRGKHLCEWVLLPRISHIPHRQKKKKRHKKQGNNCHLPNMTF